MSRRVMCGARVAGTGRDSGGDPVLRYCFLEKFHPGPHLARLLGNVLHRWVADPLRVA